MVIFHSYVKLPEGISMVQWYWYLWEVKVWNLVRPTAWCPGTAAERGSFAPTEIARSRAAGSKSSPCGPGGESLGDDVENDAILGPPLRWGTTGMHRPTTGIFRRLLTFKWGCIIYSTQRGDLQISKTLDHWNEDLDWAKDTPECIFMI